MTDDANSPTTTTFSSTAALDSSPFSSSSAALCSSSPAPVTKGFRSETQCTVNNTQSDLIDRQLPSLYLLAKGKRARDSFPCSERLRLRRRVRGRWRLARNQKAREVSGGPRRRRI
ncbi:unnamed protein product [Linum trigynum]|uniref:Uncharacterized protein n=1 Tax=Linum trigynum TaxID=586398 RepID=A0AAV2CCV1_9ROSI